MIDGVNYEYDLIKFVCYDGECKFINLDLYCVVNLIY